MLLFQSKTQLDLYKAKLSWLYYVEKRETFFELKKNLRDTTRSLEAREKEKKFIDGKIKRLDKSLEDLETKIRTLTSGNNSNLKEYEKMVSEVNLVLQKFNRTQNVIVNCKNDYLPYLVTSCVQVNRRSEKIEDVRHSFRLTLEAEKDRKLKITSYKNQYEAALADFEKHNKEAVEMNAEEKLSQVQSQLNLYVTNLTYQKLY